MTRNNLLVFDLDGTLLDSLPSLAKSFNWALQKMGHPIHPVTNYKYIIGDGAQEGAKRCLPKNYRRYKQQRKDNTGGTRRIDREEPFKGL